MRAVMRKTSRLDRMDTSPQSDTVVMSTTPSTDAQNTTKFLLNDYDRMNQSRSAMGQHVSSNNSANNMNNSVGGAQLGIAAAPPPAAVMSQPGQPTAVGTGQNSSSFFSNAAYATIKTEPGVDNSYAIQQNTSQKSTVLQQHHQRQQHFLDDMKAVKVRKRKVLDMDRKGGGSHYNDDIIPVDDPLADPLDISEAKRKEAIDRMYAYDGVDTVKRKDIKLEKPPPPSYEASTENKNRRDGKMEKLHNFLAKRRASNEFSATTTSASSADTSSCDLAALREKVYGAGSAATFAQFNLVPSNDAIPTAAEVREAVKREKIKKARSEQQHHAGSLDTRKSPIVLDLTESDTISSKKFSSPSSNASARSSSGGTATTNNSGGSSVQSLNAAVLLKRPGIEIFPIPGSTAPISIPSSITVTPVIKSTSSSSLSYSSDDKYKDRKEKKDRKDYDKRDKKRRREDSPSSSSSKSKVQIISSGSGLKHTSCSSLSSMDKYKNESCSKISSLAAKSGSAPYSPSKRHPSSPSLSSKSTSIHSKLSYSPSQKSNNSKTIYSPSQNPHSSSTASPKNTSSPKLSSSPKHSGLSPKHTSSGKPSLNALKSTSSSTSNFSKPNLSPKLGSSVSSSSGSSSSSKTCSSNQGSNSSHSYSKDRNTNCSPSRSVSSTNVTVVGSISSNLGSTLSSSSKSKVSSSGSVNSGSTPTSSNNTTTTSSTTTTTISSSSISSHSEKTKPTSTDLISITKVPISETSTSVSHSFFSASNPTVSSAIPDKSSFLLDKAKASPPKNRKGSCLSDIVDKLRAGVSGGSDSVCLLESVDKKDVTKVGGLTDLKKDPDKKTDYTIKPLDGLKLSINKARTKELKENLLKLSINSNSLSPVPKTSKSSSGLKPGVVSGPASKKVSMSSLPPIPKLTSTSSSNATVSMSPLSSLAGFSSASTTSYNSTSAIPPYGYNASHYQKERIKEKSERGSTTCDRSKTKEQSSSTSSKTSTTSSSEKQGISVSNTSNTPSLGNINKGRDESKPISGSTSSSGSRKAASDIDRYSSKSQQPRPGNAEKTDKQESTEPVHNVVTSGRNSVETIVSNCLSAASQSLAAASKGSDITNDYIKFRSPDAKDPKLKDAFISNSAFLQNMKTHSGPPPPYVGKSVQSDDTNKPADRTKEHSGNLNRKLDTDSKSIETNHISSSGNSNSAVLKQLPNSGGTLGTTASSQPSKVSAPQPSVKNSLSTTGSVSSSTSNSNSSSSIGVLSNNVCLPPPPPPPPPPPAQPHGGYGHPLSPSVSIKIVKSPVSSPLNMISPLSVSSQLSPCVIDDDLMDEALMGPRK